MGHSENDPVFKNRRAWNAGRKLGAKRALKPQQVWAVRFWLDREQRVHDRAMFDLAIDSKLRGCDLVKLRVGDLVSGGRVAHGPSLSRARLAAPCNSKSSDQHPDVAEMPWRHPGRLRLSKPDDHADHISTRQYARLVDEWVTGTGLRREDHGTHSLRRTKASLIYKRTGNLRAVQILLGHTKIESTVRHLGVDVEDALILAEATEV